MGVFELPEGYSEVKRVNLQTNKKLAVLLNVGAILIAGVLFFVGLAFVPFSFEPGADNLPSFLLQVFGVLLAIVLYMVAHEFVHGVFIKKYSGKKAKYGFTGAYAYAGSDAYFNKRQYVVIALAPIVLFGIAFLLLNVLLPAKWFWGVYVLQLVNLSGAVGDLYITWLMGRLPADVLTCDVGVEMFMYSRTK